MPTSATGARPQSGFTLLELIVALTIVALLAGLSMPMAGRMLDGMRYREGLREVRSTLEAARYRAITQGRPVDVRIYVADRRLEVPGRRALTLHESLTLQATTAREVNQGGAAVIRFFPDGGATGGEVVVQRGSSGPGSRLRVDWLLGRTTLHALDA
jgi:general secretion pathway protein H